MPSLASLKSPSESSPGGGTPRLPRFIGKSKAMEMCLTGHIIDAAEAERAGLVARIVPIAELVDKAVRAVDKSAGLSRQVTMMIKECMNRAYEGALVERLLFERRALHAAFALHDQKEGCMLLSRSGLQVHQFLKQQPGLTRKTCNEHSNFFLYKPTQA